MAEKEVNKAVPEGLSQDTGESNELIEDELDKITGGTTSGLGALIQVTALKAANANDDALQAAKFQEQQNNSSSKNPLFRK